jgi:hypothetical protein
MLMNVCFLVMHLLCICCACDFMFRNWSLGERKSEWVSIVSLSEPEDSYKECSWICPQGVRDCRVQLEIAFVLISSRVQVGTMPCKECVGQVKTQSYDSEQKGWRISVVGLCRIEELHHLVVIEYFPQGMRARVSSWEFWRCKISGEIGL